MKPPISARPLSRFSLLIQKNPSNALKFIFEISRFNTFSSSVGTGSGNTTSYAMRRYEEESRNVRVSVWWDFENCHLPMGTNVYRVSQFVTAAIRATGIKGPIQITAFGDVSQLSRVNQEALSSTGINLAHVPNGGKNSADRSLLIDLMYWVSQNPPPAHLFLISGDRDFAGILHRLRMNNYNILLASPESAPSVLCSAASIMWNWNCLLNGENLSGKHYNQPPDGPYGSWYGHYRVPLEDPFAVAEQAVCPRSEDIPDNGSDAKVRPIPKIVVRQIRQILRLYPKGISITELRAELSKSSVNIDKDFYGYKKFSRFLSAMPMILKLQSASDGQFLVHGVVQKVSEEVESSPGITSGPGVNGKPDFHRLSKSNGENTSSTQNEEGKSKLPSSSEEPMEITAPKMQKTEQPQEGPRLPGPKLTFQPVELQEQATAAQEECREGKEQPAVVHTVDEGKVIQSHLHKLEELTPPSELGFFKRIWRKWFGHKAGGLQENVCTMNGLTSFEKMKAKEKDVNSATQVKSVVPPSLSLSCSDTMTGHEAPELSEATTDRNIENSGFFGQILRKLRFLRAPVDFDGSSEEVRENMIETERNSDKNEVFAKESFWDELGKFFGTAEAAALVLQSATRKQLVQSLQEKGPSILRSLSEAELNHLLKLLILDKKWIEESSSESSPFKPVHVEDKCSLGNSSANPLHSTGLSSIFSKPQESSFAQKLQELDGKAKHPNSSLSGISKPFGRSRVLGDCKKLIDELLKDSPEGFLMASFRRLFLEKYGYALDIQNLGYSKLALFLQAFPGVRIESTLVVPSRKSPIEQFLQEIKTEGTESNSENEASDASGKEDDCDSVWEELGPVATSGRQKGEKQSGPRWKPKGESEEKSHHDYESLSDNYLSESDDEVASSVKSESTKKCSVDVEDSSLLQILDSWYGSKDHSSKEEAGNKDGSELLDAVADTYGSDLGESTSAELKMKNETPLTRNGWKHKSSKSYSFVTDHSTESRDKLVDGMLERLKKTNERSSKLRF